MMLVCNKRRHQTSKRTGNGLINTIINKLPFEAHIPGYNYCGPGTRLHKRLARGDRGINPLDEACKEHDIAYSQSSDTSKRHEADEILAKKAFHRFKSSSSSFGEKAAALAVTGIMKGKVKLGMGVKPKAKLVKAKSSFNGTVKKIRCMLRKPDLLNSSRLALAAIKKKPNPPKQRIIPIPKTGGILPLIPIFAALSALGALGGGAAGIAKAVNDAKSARESLQEAQRHNRSIEAVSIGRGLYLKPYKQDLGLHLNTCSKN